MEPRIQFNDNRYIEAQRLSTRSSQPGLIFANVAVKPTNLSTETGEGKQGLQPASVDNSSVTKETKCFDLFV